MSAFQSNVRNTQGPDQAQDTKLELKKLELEKERIELEKKRIDLSKSRWHLLERTIIAALGLSTSISIAS